MKIGFVGLGIMGESICANIVKKHDDTVPAFDFAKVKMNLPASQGEVSCSSTREVVEHADIFISFVSGILLLF